MGKKRSGIKSYNAVCGQCRNFVGNDHQVDLKKAECPKAGVVKNTTKVSGCSRFK